MGAGDQPARFHLVRRYSFANSVAVGTPAGSNTVAFNGARFNLPVITPDQAMRVISGFASVQDASNTHFLTKLGAAFGINLASAAGFPAGPFVRCWQDDYAPIVLGGTGSCWGFIDDEFLYGTDYLELLGQALFSGAAAGHFSAGIVYDASNSDVAAHNINSVLTMIVEVYQLRPGV